MQLLLCNIDTNNNLSQFLKTPSLLLSENNISLPLLKNQVVIDRKSPFLGINIISNRTNSTKIRLVRLYGTRDT